MKVRNDFVSNSSSSSYIITTKESSEALIDFIVKNAHRPNNDGQCYWNKAYDMNNQTFLERNLDPNPAYVLLAVGDFTPFGYQLCCIEDEEQQIKDGTSFANVVVRRDDIKKFIKDGNVKVTFKDLQGGKYADMFRHLRYNVYEITQDTIDFTRWLLTNCDSRDCLEFKTLNDFYDNELPEDYRNGTVENPDKALVDKLKYLSDTCYGMMFEPEYTTYEKDCDGYEKKTHPVSELLDKYEAALKEGNRIYRIVFGSDGEGTDWSSYVWTENAEFDGDTRFKFEYDVFF